jgi:two-component sensor histidine kinase
MRERAAIRSVYSRSLPAYTLADTPLAHLDFVSSDERAALSRVPVAARVLAAGSVLVPEGSSSDDVYVLIEGYACRSATTRQGTRQITALLVPGGVCNLDTLYFERADFGVHAITEVTVVALPRSTAVALTVEHPGIGRAFTALSIAENAILARWAVSLGRRSSEERLAHLLCELSIRLATTGESKASFELPLTQEVIGDMLGLTAVHVNRTMRHLRNEKIIATSGRTVTILDGDRLRSLAQFDSSYLALSSAEQPSLPVRDDDLLLRETHHRCSNDLQLVIGLLQLQSRRTGSDEARDALSEAAERVAVLARARNALNRERQPSLQAALGQVCEALQIHAEPRSILVSTHVESDVQDLSPVQTSTIALVVNELATNAIKHAFKDAGGHVHIKIAAKPGRDLTIIVDDDGLPFHDAPPLAGSGLGLGLVRRLMASIGGLLIPPPPGSKMFELRVPVSSR